jgi:phage tail-like protein
MADANGQRFWLRSGQDDWTAVATTAGQPPPAYDAKRRTWGLGSYARASFTEAPADAAARWALPRMVSDAHGTFAFLDAGSGDVHASGATASSVAIHSPAVSPSDMLVGGDGVLFLIEGDEVVLVDLRDRWDDVRLSQPGFAPARLAAVGGGVWILDRTNRRLARLSGKPLPRRGLRVRAPDVFEPREENPDPPRLDIRALPLASGEVPIDIAASEEGRLALLSWRGASEAVVRFVDPEGALSAAHILGEVARPYSLGWIDRDTLAVLVATLHRPDPEGPEVPGGSEVVTYVAEHHDTDIVRPPLGEVYPLPGHDLAPFVRGVSPPLRYAMRRAAGASMPAPRKLTRVSANFLARGGELRVASDEPLDSGQVGFVWHRAYLEAHFPPACGARLEVAASDDRSSPPARFFAHVFGDIERTATHPRAVWSSQASELPFHPGLLPCPSRPERSGLFSVLLQRAGLRVSTVSGRYLWVRLVLEGNGYGSPEIAALRVYGSRFSYVQRYLPRIFHEQLVPPEADDPVSLGGPSPADFLERFVCNFEGVLTPLEDRVANAHLLTDPATIPEESLDWLGSWIGFVFDAAYPAQHRREALHNAMELHRLRGTARGLKLAIDILTGGRMVDGQMVGGAATTGRVVILEGWRLRRTFATLLGVDLSHSDDPLLVGVARSGNSRVGDSLIISQEHRPELFALLRRTLPGDGPPQGATLEEWISWYIEEIVDRFAVEPFLDELAYRLVVLVHDELGADIVGLVERVAALEAPAHLETEVQRATHPFLVGLASLVGVDTYLRAPQPKPALFVDESTLGTRGFLSRPAALDPRLEGASS